MSLSEQDQRIEKRGSCGFPSDPKQCVLWLSDSELQEHDFNSNQIHALSKRRVDTDNGSVVFFFFTKVHLPQFMLYN